MQLLVGKLCPEDNSEYGLKGHRNEGLTKITGLQGYVFEMKGKEWVYVASEQEGGGWYGIME